MTPNGMFTFWRILECPAHFITSNKVSEQPQRYLRVLAIDHKSCNNNPGKFNINSSRNVTTWYIYLIYITIYFHQHPQNSICAYSNHLCRTTCKTWCEAIQLPKQQFMFLSSLMYGGLSFFQRFIWEQKLYPEEISNSAVHLKKSILLRRLPLK